jgi:hypothetical protein
MTAAKEPSFRESVDLMFNRAVGLLDLPKGLEEVCHECWKDQTSQGKFRRQEDGQTRNQNKRHRESHNPLDKARHKGDSKSKEHLLWCQKCEYYVHSDFISVAVASARQIIRVILNQIDARKRIFIVLQVRKRYAPHKLVKDRRKWRMMDKT